VQGALRNRTLFGFIQQHNRNIMLLFFYGVEKNHSFLILPDSYLFLLMCSP